MIAVEEDQESATSRRHHQQPPISETIRLQLSCAIKSTDGIELILRASVEDAQVQIAARVVDTPVLVVGIEYTMDDEVGKSEEQRGHAIWMFGKFITLEESIEDKVRVR